MRYLLIFLFLVSGAFAQEISFVEKQVNVWEMQRGLSTAKGSTTYDSINPTKVVDIWRNGTNYNHQIRQIHRITRKQVRKLEKEESVRETLNTDVEALILELRRLGFNVTKDGVSRQRR